MVGATHCIDEEQMSRETEESRSDSMIPKDAPFYKNCATPPRRWLLLISINDARRCSTVQQVRVRLRMEEAHRPCSPPSPPHPVSIGPKVAVAYEERKKT